MAKVTDSVWIPFTERLQNLKHLSFQDFLPSTITYLKNEQKDRAFFKSLCKQDLELADIGIGDRYLVSPFYFDHGSKRIYDARGTMGRLCGEGIFKEKNILQRSLHAFLMPVIKTIKVALHLFAIASFAPFWLDYSILDNCKAKNLKEVLSFYGYHIVQILFSPLTIALTSLNSIAYLFSQNYGAKLQITFERLTCGLVSSSDPLISFLQKDGILRISRTFSNKEIQKAQELL